MKRFHVVGISTRAYRCLASFASRDDAVKDLLSRKYSSFGCILRDGNTGKRYTAAECKAFGTA